MIGEPTVHYVELMLLDPADPASPVITIALGFLGLFITLFLIYLVIRLAITHGMLAYSRRLEEDRHLPVHRN